MSTDAVANRPTVRAHATRKARLSPMARQEEIAGWLMASPWILGILIWILGPFAAAAYLSFTDYDILSRSDFVGLGNFRTMLTDDPLFWKSMWVTTVYSFVSTPLQIVLGLALALLLNTKIRGLAWFRTVYYLPTVLSGVAVSFLWIWVFSADWGVLNYILSWFGIKGPNWLTSERWALPSLILMSLWGVGGGMVIYLAGLQGVPSEFYEAAEVDGANPWHKFWHITLPMISPVILFQLIIGIIGALQTFTQGYVMTEGGPNNATLFYVLYLWRNAFERLQMGYASALAWAIFAYILVLTLLVLRSSSVWVYYTGEVKGR